MVRGSCLCGDVSFEADGPFELMGHCHCTKCRKHHGTAYQTWLMAPTAGFRLSGADKVRRWNGRTSCLRCGSVVPDPTPSGPSLGIPAGLLDDDPGIRPQVHVLVSCKAPWFAITDELPRHDEYPEGWGDAVDYARPTEPAPGKIRGSCLCGGVAFELDAPPRMIYACHCRRCRKARAAAFATNTFVDLATFRFLRGADLVETYKVPDADRFRNPFCRVCGGRTPYAIEAAGRAIVPVGLFDDDPVARIGVHYHVSSMAPWDAITDDIPQKAEQ